MIKIKTLIELFDDCQIENMIAGLKFEPEKIIFLGFKKTMTAKRKADLAHFLEIKGLNIILEYEVVGRYDYQEIVDRLLYILGKNEECAFDLTGGKELVLLAMGNVASSHNIPMFQFDIHNDKFIEIKACNELPKEKQISLTISENIALNGGSIINSSYDDSKWKLTNDFKGDIWNAWVVCARDCNLWNKNSTTFGLIEHFGANNGLYVKSDIKQVSSIIDFPVFYEEILLGLRDKGLVQKCKVDENTLEFRYKNDQVRKLLLKGGNILELYTYMIANEISAENDDFYNDTDIGVFIDWDGVVHNFKESVKDTRNEIDVMLMRGVKPVFISCKNGELKKEALYELDTVANRFGGEYAKRIIITTDAGNSFEGYKYIMQRAKDMNIKIISDVNKMSKEEFKEVFAKIAK